VSDYPDKDPERDDEHDRSVRLVHNALWLIGWSGVMMLLIAITAAIVTKHF
jgi:hypothetical protein